MATEAKRRLKKVDVNFISLVDKAANGKQIIFKSANSASPNISKTINIIKTDEEKRLVYGTVYEPEVADTQGDIAEASVIEKAAHDFLSKLNNKNVDTQHDFNPDDGSVVESFILRSADPMFPETAIGSWVVAIKVAKDETWDAVKKGEITGLSLAGLAVVEEIKKNESGFSAILTGIQESISKITKAIFPTVEIKKDFNSALNRRLVNDYVYTLERSIDDVMYNDEIVDKKAAIMTNIEQFKTAMEQVEIAKSENVSKSAIIKSEEVDMKPEEIQNLVKTAVTEAVKPLQDEVTALKSANDTLKSELCARLEKVETATPGSTQVKKEAEGGEQKSVNIWI